MNSKSRSSRTRWAITFECFRFPSKMSSDADKVSKIAAFWQLNFKEDTTTNLLTEISWDKDLLLVQFLNSFSFCSYTSRYRLAKCQELCCKTSWGRTQLSQQTSLKRRSTSRSRRQRKAKSFIIILIICNWGHLIILTTSRKSRSSNG